MKHSQITLVMMVVLLVFLALAAVIFVNSTVRENRAQTTSLKSAAAPVDVKLVRAYVESCLRDVSLKSLVLAGRQGSYFSPLGNSTYADPGCKNYTSYNGTLLPLFVAGDSYYVPQLGELTERLRRYVAVEVEKCLDIPGLRERNYYVSIPDVDWQAIGFDFDLANVQYSSTAVNVSVFPGQDDIVFQLEFPILVEKGGSRSILTDFIASLDIPLMAIHQNVTALCSQLVAEESYDLSLHCPEYSSVSKILFLNSTLVRFVHNASGREFFFDFGVNDSGLSGECN